MTRKRDELVEISPALARPLTTAEAAAWLGYRSSAGVRAAVARGELRPMGRGARGTYLFDAGELARFVRARLGYPERKVAPGAEMNTNEKEVQETVSQSWGASGTRFW